MSTPDQFEIEAIYEITRLIAATLHAQNVLSLDELKTLQHHMQQQEKPLVGRLDEGPMDWINPAE